MTSYKNRVRRTDINLSRVPKRDKRDFGRKKILMTEQLNFS